MKLLGIASILGKLAMTKAAVAGVKNQLHPDKMEQVLKDVIEKGGCALVPQKH